MKKPSIFTFHIWNPLKDIHLSIELRLVNKEWRQDYSFLFSFIFFQIEIDFKTAYFTIKNFFNGKSK